MTHNLLDGGSVRTGMYIDGRFRAAEDGRTHPTYDPASGRELAAVSISSAADVDEAVSTSAQAFRKSWRPTAPAARARILLKTAEILRRDLQKLARLESLDSGKPLREALGDVETSARYFEYYAGIADKYEGRSIPLSSGMMSFSIYEPLGVTAHIIPWNFPLVTTARGAAPALAAGSTVIVKPAEQTPLSALALGDVLAEAGLPAGCYNVVAGLGRETGQALVDHSGVAHVTFTGSVVTGKRVMRSAADHVASVTLELGGKSPVVVLKDAAPEAAITGIMSAIFTNAGQVCSAGSRLIVEKGIAETILSEVVKRARALGFGRGLDNPGLGPLVSGEQQAKVDGYLQRARDAGQEILTGGRIPVVQGLEGGWFFEPTLVMCPNSSSPIVQEEIFGPVLAVQVADDAEHALELANGTEFGLVAGIYTADISKALAFARDVEAGQVFINKYFAGGVETPFGGIRNSGFGREKGLEAMRNYVYCKTVTTAF